MSIRDYPGFKWQTMPNSTGGVYDVWTSTFSSDAVFSIEGKFYKVSSMKKFETIYEAMDYIKHKAIINFFDEN